MGRQGEAFTQRLRRLARALVDDSDSADALVLEALTAAEERSLDLNGLFAILIARRRVRADAPARRRQRLPGSQPDIVRAFEALPLPDREVLALQWSSSNFAYEDAARVLDLRETPSSPG